MKVRGKCYDNRCERKCDVMKIGVLKNVVNFTGKQLCWSLSLIKFKIDSNTGVFLRVFVNF